MQHNHAANTQKKFVRTRKKIEQIARNRQETLKVACKRAAHSLRKRMTGVLGSTESRNQGIIAETDRDRCLHQGRKSTKSSERN